MSGVYLTADMRYCGTCNSFEPNGTRYGGVCRNPTSDYYCVIISVLKNDESIDRCHSAASQLREDSQS